MSTDARENDIDVIPRQLLYTMIRVSDLERSVAFYRDMLGMRELRRETFPDGGFTLVFMGYSDSTPHASIELTYNWDDRDYDLGDGFGHVALEVGDLVAACQRLESAGVPIVRAPGPMNWAPAETGELENIAFIEDPDGYKIELIEAAKR